MKKLFLTGFMFFMFAAVNAQIGDVQQKGNLLTTFDGSKKIGSFYISDSDILLGYSSSIIVIQHGSMLISYNATGKKQGSFYISSGDQFKNVLDDKINIRKGNMLITFDVNGKKISSRYL
jgi:hypothetical protein